LKLSPLRWRLGLKLHSWLAQHPGLYQACTSIAIRCLHVIGRRRGALRSLGVKNGWTQVRDFPAPQARTFMQQWKQLKRKQAR